MIIKHIEKFSENYQAIAHIINLKSSRKELDLIYNKLCGVEVGVRQGFFSEYLLRTFSNLHMVGVDPYLPYQDIHEMYTQEMQDALRHEAEDRLKIFGNRMSLYTLKSVDAASDKRIDYRKYNFVFIDAVHTYEAVKEDLAAWKDKLYIKGFLSGHDFDMEGVKQAVVEFAGNIGANIHHFGYPADVWYMDL